MLSLLFTANRKNCQFKLEENRYPTVVTFQKYILHRQYSRNQTNTNHKTVQNYTSLYLRKMEKLKNGSWITTISLEMKSYRDDISANKKLCYNKKCNV